MEERGPSTRQNIVAQNALSHGGATAITLGNDQYYERLPVSNSPRSIALIGHETFHSYHAECTTGTVAFVISYGLDSTAALIEGEDPYHKNISEILGHALQDAINDELTAYPNLLDNFKPGNNLSLPPNLPEEIRHAFQTRLLEHLRIKP